MSLTSKDRPAESGCLSNGVLTSKGSFGQDIEQPQDRGTSPDPIALLPDTQQNQQMMTPPRSHATQESKEQAPAPGSKAVACPDKELSAQDIVSCLAGFKFGEAKAITPGQFTTRHFRPRCLDETQAASIPGAHLSEVSEELSQLASLRLPDNSSGQQKTRQTLDEAAYIANIQLHAPQPDPCSPSTRGSHSEGDGTDLRRPDQSLGPSTDSSKGSWTIQPSSESNVATRGQTSKPIVPHLRPSGVEASSSAQDPVGQDEAARRRSPEEAQNPFDVNRPFENENCPPDNESMPSAGGGRRVRRAPRPKPHDLQFPTRPARSAVKSAHRRGPNHREMISRPVRQETVVSESLTPETRRYASSRGSNISKRRDALPSSPCGTSVTLKKHTEQFGHDFANTFNAFHVRLLEQEKRDLHNKEKFDKLIQTISAQEKHLESRDRTIAEQAECIDHLQGIHEQLVGQYAELESHVEASAARKSKLEEKCRSYKEHINAAIEEVHDLNTRVKKACQQALDEIQAQEQRRKVSEERVLQQTDRVRENLMERVKSVIVQAKAEAQELNSKISGLELQIAQRDAAIVEEKERVRTLTKQLEDEKPVQSSFQDLDTQVKQILDKIDRQQVQTSKIVEVVCEQNKAKLDTITDRLSSLTEKSQPIPEILSKLNDIQAENGTMILPKLDAVMNSHAQVGNATIQLGEEIKEHIEDMWNFLETREDALVKQLDDKNQENACITTIVEEKEKECESLHDQLQNEKEFTQHMKDQLTQLQKEHREGAEVPEELGHLKEEVDQLRDDVAAREAQVAELEERLSAQDKVFLVETQKYGQDTQKLSQLFHDRESSSRLAVEQAVDVTRREARLELEVAEQLHQDLLEQVAKTKQSSRQDVEALEKRLFTIESKAKQDTATIGSLKEELNTANARVAELTEQTRKLSELDSDHERDTAAIRKLEERLPKEENMPRMMDSQNKLEKEGSRVSADELDQCIASEGVLSCISSNLGGLCTGLISPEVYAERLKGVLCDTVRNWVQNVGEDQRTEVHPSLDGDIGGMQQDTQILRTAKSEPDNLTDIAGERFMDILSHTSHVADNARKLRVIVRSPESRQPTPDTLSVEEEKARRRVGLGPRPILKKSCDISISERSLLAQEGQGVGVIPNESVFALTQRNISTAGAKQENTSKLEVDSRSVGPRLSKVRGNQGSTVGLSDSAELERQQSAGNRPHQGLKRMAIQYEDLSIEPPKRRRKRPKYGLGSLVTDLNSPPLTTLETTMKAEGEQLSDWAKSMASYLYSQGASVAGGQEKCEPNIGPFQHAKSGDGKCSPPLLLAPTKDTPATAPYGSSQAGELRRAPRKSSTRKYGSQPDRSTINSHAKCEENSDVKPEDCIPSITSKLNRRYSMAGAASKDLA